MSETVEKREKPPLTDEQRKLVRDNVGLVTVHLRRYVRNLGTPRRDREWDDLFQEGCLGLMQAARLFRADSGIPFAAFALPRIHNAVSRALQNKFSTVHVPPARKRDEGVGSAVRTNDPYRDREGAGTGNHNEAKATTRRIQRRKSANPLDSGHPPGDPASTFRPKVRSLSDETSRRLRDTRRHDPSEFIRDDDADLETIGQRLRRKYERAVRDAGGDLARSASRRGDRDQLIRVLQEERFLVPHEESRRALRQIARDTKSSYARVAQCDKQLAEAIRTRLEADPEFVELRRFARESDEGCELGIDEALEHDLAGAGAEAFVRRFHEADPTERGVMLDALIACGAADLDDVLRRRVIELPADQRERLLQFACVPSSSST